VFVAAARFTLRIEASHSLKEKRAVVRRVVDRVQQKFRLVLSEVGGAEVLDTWQRADLGFAVMTRSRDQAEDAVASVLGFVDSLGMAERIHAHHEITAYGDDWYGEPRDVRAQKPEDEAWIPAAWREETS
jgi:uncharacterized protein YlxP (DUF503 family)